MVKGGPTHSTGSARPATQGKWLGSKYGPPFVLRVALFRCRRASAVANWPLHDIAITNVVWRMAYKRGVGGGVVYCAIDVQKYCNSAGYAGGRGQ